MINREDFEDFELYYTQQVLKNPALRYGECFFAFFPELDYMSFNPGSSPAGHAVYVIVTETDKEKAREMCLSYVLDDEV